MILPNGYVIQEGYKKVGGYGTVYSCIKDGKKYALKVFTNNSDQYLHEVHLYKILQSHESVLKLIDNFDLDNDKKAMVLEFCSIDLKFYLNTIKVQYYLKIIFFTQIVGAFKAIQEYLERINFQFQHRDIKPENLMIGENFQIRLIDFGESRIVDISEDKKIYNILPSTQLCGTPGYMDPMMEFLGKGFSEKSDLWSLGATLYYILTNKVLDIDKSAMNKEIKLIPLGQRKQFKMNYIQKVVNSIILQNIENESCRTLLSKLLIVEPKKRYNWQDLFRDPFIQGQIQDGQCYFEQIQRKRIIRLEDRTASNYFSSEFERATGKDLASVLSDMISRGLYYFKVAQIMFKAFQKLKQKNINFLNNWQNFEKCNYLLTLKSLIIFHSYTQMFSLRNHKYRRESFDQTLFKILMLEQNHPIFERVQFQIYYLFDCIRKNMQGLETRFYHLQRHALKENEIQEYSNILEISQDEKALFSFKKNDPKNQNNNPDNFDNDKFQDILREYLLLSIKVFLENYKILEQKQLIVLWKMIYCLEDYSKFSCRLPLLKKSKTKILTQLFSNFYYLDGLINFKAFFNTYFYFEIVYFNQIDEEEAKKFQQILKEEFTGKLCTCSFAKNDRIKGIIIYFKCQQIKKEIWNNQEGKNTFEIDQIIKMIDDTISNYL